MELLRLAISSLIVKWLPQKIKYRAANILYPFNSAKSRGVDLTVEYLPKKYGLKFHLNTHEYIGWNIFFLGSYEPDTNAILAEFIKPGMIVIEAGANHGSETVIIASLVGINGKVFAFEPIPKIIDKLLINININKLNKIIKVESLALGESNKNIVFHIPYDNESNQGVSSKYKFGSKSDTLVVQQVKLDSWIQENHISKIDFIKMDIQGSEYDLMLGASECLAKFNPIVYLEADEIQTQNGSTSLESLYNILKTHSYDVFSVRKGERVALTPQNLESGNWLAIPSKKNEKINI